MTTDPGSGLPGSGPSPAEPREAEASDRLQAMLAQASQGQLDEQREITAALVELRNQLQRVSQEIAELRVAPPAEPVDGGAINNVTVEVREAVRFLSDRLDGVTRMVAQRGEELADVRTALTAIDAHVRSQAETIGVLSTGLQALPSYGERVSGLQENIDGIRQRLTGIEVAVARPTDSGVNNRLAAIEASLSRPTESGVGERLTSIEAAITPLRQQIASAGQVASDHGTALAETAASLEALHGKIESLAAGTQAALATPPSFDESAISSLDQRLGSVAADLTALSQEVASFVSGAGSGGSVTGDDVERAMRETEQRLRSHVDDAVIALANVLLRPRSTPAAATPSVFEPAAPSANHGGGGDDDLDQPSASAAAPTWTADEPEAVETTRWWERDDETSVSNAPAAPALDEESTTAEAGAVDFSQADWIDEDDEDDDSDGSDQDGAGPAASHVPAADTAPVETASWSPEVPGSRPDASEQADATIVPERKRRFFGGNKK